MHPHLFPNGSNNHVSLFLSLLGTTLRSLVVALVLDMVVVVVKILNIGCVGYNNSGAAPVGLCLPVQFPSTYFFIIIFTDCKVTVTFTFDHWYRISISLNSKWQPIKIWRNPQSSHEISHSRGQNHVFWGHWDLDLWPPKSNQLIQVNMCAKFEIISIRSSWDITFTRQKLVFERSQWPWALTARHQNRTSSSLSPSECFYRIWRHSLKLILRYHVQGKRNHNLWGHSDRIVDPWLMFW